MKMILSSAPLAAVFLFTSLISLAGLNERTFVNNGPVPPPLIQETLEEKNRSLLMNYLRENFDDIHDVSMRFHHKDHNLNGLIDFSLTFERGKLVDSRVLANETGDPEFPEALLEKMESWEIEGLEGPFETRLPFRIQIVGSDDPSFHEKSIFTGKVADENGNPVWRAQIDFIPAEGGKDSIQPCRTNREGIFVRTLIPPGKWDVQCIRDGYETVLLKNLEFHGGEHLRKEFVLKEAAKE